MTITDVTEKILINVMGALLSSLPGSVQRKTGKGKVVNRVHSISTSQYDKFLAESFALPNIIRIFAGRLRNTLRRKKKYDEYNKCKYIQNEKRIGWPKLSVIRFEEYTNP
jgi:hypothetical protein